MGVFLSTVFLAQSQAFVQLEPWAMSALPVAASDDFVQQLVWCVQRFANKPALAQSPRPSLARWPRSVFAPGKLRTALHSLATVGARRADVVDTKLKSEIRSILDACAA